MSCNTQVINQRPNAREYDIQRWGYVSIITVGGNGGVGQGHNQSLTNGIPESAGGTNAANKEF